MYDHILVPIAMDHRPNIADALDISQKLVNEGGRITALSVVEPVPNYIAAQLPDGQEAHNLAATKSMLEDEVSSVAGVQTATAIGHPGQTIVEFASEHGVDCIVVASHRPGLKDYFLGSTAARVVRHAPCAVHVVR